MEHSDRSAIRLAFGHQVRRLRVEKGFSQESLADLAGIHRTYLGSVERGERNIALENIDKIASALGMTMSALLHGVDDGKTDR